MTDFSVTITAKSGDRVLTEIVYPGQDYAELVTTQYLIAMGLFRGGLIMADAKGVEIPAELRALIEA